MKHLRKLTLAGVSLAALTAAGPAVGDTVVALSPYDTVANQRSRIESVARHLSDAVAPGEVAHILDGHGLRLIGTFAVPDKDGYKNPRAKLAVNKAALGALLRFANDARTDADKIGRIDLPGLLRYVGKNHPADDESDLIVFGNPLHDDPRIPASSMQGGHVPNDGHIAATRARSPYGTAGLKGRLKGYRVHMGLPTTDWAVTDQHAHFVQRFWALSIGAQGGRLATFTADPATLFRQASNPTPSSGDGYTLGTVDKLEMLPFRPQRVTLPIYDRELTPKPPKMRELRRAHEVEVGISWVCGDCDFDLYARPGAHAQVIYFNRPGTGEGRLFKDYRQSPAITGGFETISFTAPIDLTALRLAINFYAGRVPAGGAKGEVRIAIGGRTWAKPFRITATDGNKGKAAKAVMNSGRAANKGWIVIDPAGVTGLR